MSKSCNRKKRRRRREISDAVYNAMIIVFLLIALVCSAMLMMREYTIWKADRVYDRLAKNTVIEYTTTAENDTAEDSVKVPETQSVSDYEYEVRRIYEQYGVTVPMKKIDFDNLHETISEDIYAWIYIPNTHIDYPVLQHPTDNSYYLEHNLDGSEGYPGCICTENYNSKDFSDRQTVIYGHNMRDTTMFSDLHKYEDQEFFDENKYVFLYTEDMVYVYKIFAAYQTDNSHQLLNYDFNKEGTLLSYLDNVRTLQSELKLFDDDVEFSADDHLLTLSTCVMKERQFHLRYLVQALML